MTHTSVDQLLYLMDRAFYAPEGDDPEHALLKNLAPVTDQDWLRAAPSGGRTIVQIAWHVAACKFMYANHGFEDGKLDWPELFDHWESAPPKSEMVAWLEEAHVHFRRIVEQLEDSDLTVHRKAPWGETFETRFLISNVIEHDLYHSGEMNLIRALLQGTDAWPKYDDN
jgi:uncharacterized damage-inducible protein DinB